ncbi:MAG: PEGA domain-containing protein [Gemmatimonadaceae bacterium]
MSDDETGMTRVTVLGSMRRDVSPQQRLQKAVQESLRGQFDLHGELGRDDVGGVIYLATELTSRRLVALKLSRAGGAGEDEDWDITVVRKLDASVPSLESRCPSCGGKLKSWARFCRHCGADLSGAGEGDDTATSSEEMLVQVRAAARGRYDILGQMDRADGGGIVYFAKDAKTRKLIALRLLRQAPSAGGTEILQLQPTAQSLNDFRDSVGAHEAAATIVDGPTLPPQHNSPKAAAARDVEPPPQHFGGKKDFVAAPPLGQPASVDGKQGGQSRSNAGRFFFVLVGVAAVALIAYLVAQRGKNPSPVATTTIPPIADSVVKAPAVDSGSVRLGVAAPPGAVITLDGVPIGGTKLRAAVGTHVMSISAPGYETVTQDIEISASEATVWTPQFVKSAAPAAEVAARAPVTKTPKTTTPPPPKTSPVVDRSTDKSTEAPISEATARTTCTSLTTAHDYAAAVSKCNTEAEGGSASAMRMLGQLYERGQGTGADKAMAAKWYQRGAEAGDPIAQYRIGLMTLSGSGVKKDEKRGNDWLRKAADQDQPEAMYHYARSLEMGRGLKKDTQGAVAMFQKAAELGDVLSQTKLGILYSSGDGVARDEKVAADWLLKASNGGFGDAQVMLAEMYLTGKGVPASVTEARRWYTAASKNGNAKARDALARLK